jgi:hypothetical protein
MAMNASITKSELFSSYNKARAAIRRNGNNPKEIERLNKALGILQSKAYYAGDRVTYIPTVSACGCKDWEYRHAAKRQYTGPCKHMTAEQLIYAAMASRPLNVTAEMNQLAEALKG